MRNGFGVLAALCLAGAALSGSAPARSAPAPRTVTDYYDAMIAAALKLDAEQADRQKTGDMASAQRLALVAAMVRRSGSEFRGAEQEFMLDDIAGLPSPVPARIEAARKMAADAELAAADHPAFVDEAVPAFNALLAVLPQKTPHPVIYGLLSNDLADKSAPLPSDIVFYGFRFVDPIYRTPPTVLYGRTELPAEAVKIEGDRIEVQLPADIKKAVNFDPPPCAPRVAFGLRVRAVFAEKHGYWPISWHTEGESTTESYALPTPVEFSVSVVAAVETTSAETSFQSFDQKSGLVIADCQQAQSAEVAVPLPQGATDAKCTASWVDTASALKLSSHCRIDGAFARAVGQISGGAKVCSPDNLCTCSVPAQGWLEAQGTYQLEKTTTGLTTETVAGGLNFAAGGVAEQPIPPREDHKLRHLALSLTRRGCGTAVDSIDLAVGDDPRGDASNVSASGAFRASLKGGVLKVGAAEAFEPDPHATP